MVHFEECDVASGIDGQFVCADAAPWWRGCNNVCWCCGGVVVGEGEGVSQGRGGGGSLMVSNKNFSDVTAAHKVR
jgi:hypothetical protein